MPKTNDEYTKKLDIKGLEHVWINPKVYEAIRTQAQQELWNEIDELGWILKLDEERVKKKFNLK